MTRLRALVTNDDGIDAVGLHALARAAAGHDLDVLVAAPLTEASGSGASVVATERKGRVLFERRDLPDLAGVPAYAVAASPGFIVTLAVRGAFGDPPDLVLSGINRGANVGRAVLHSGTVGAALTGTLNGCRAMAFSLDIGLRPDGYYHWDTARRIANELLPLVLESPTLTAINVNVPDRPAEALRGIRQAPLTEYGSVQMTVAEVGEGFIRTSMAEDPGGELAGRHDPGSDLALLAEGYVTVTALQPHCEAIETELPLPGLAPAPAS